MGLRRAGIRRRTRLKKRSKRRRSPIVQELKSLVRELVFRRDKNRCVVAGYGKCGAPLQLSHIKPQGGYPWMKYMPQNAVVKCQRHHLYWWHKDVTEAGEWF